LAELVDEQRRATLPELGCNANFNFYDVEGLARTSESAHQRLGGHGQLGPVRASEQPIPAVAVIRPYDLNGAIWQLNGALSIQIRYNEYLITRAFAETLCNAFLDELSSTESQPRGTE
jgi:hypothetical protein